MDVFEYRGYSHKGRVKWLYDRLASVLRRLSPERRAALNEYLDEQAQTNDGRTTTQGNADQR
jgi:hypothetical protein